MTTPGEPAPHLPCHGCTFRPLSELETLDAAGIEALADAHDCRLFRAGAFVFRTGAECNSVYVLTKGLVAIRRITPDGGAMIVRLLFPVCTFDLANFLRSQRHSAEAVALIDTYVCRIEGAVFRRLAEDSPSVSAALMRRLSADLTAAEETMLAMGRMPVRERLLRLLLRLSEQCTEVGAAGSEQFQLPLSRRDMASALGIRPETLTRTIHEIDAEGLVRIRQREVEIRDTGRVLAAIGE